jgi:hypothetical protein
VNLRRAFWISAALMLAGFAAIVFWSAPRIEAGGLEPFDPRTGGYGHAEAVAFLTALTPEGRAAYLGAQRLADTIFPIGFVGVLALGIVLAYRRWSLPLALAASLVPLAYFVFDMLENAAVAGLLRSAPEAVTPEAVAWASACTVSKFRLVTAALALLALGWGLRGLALLRGRRGR